MRLTDLRPRFICYTAEGRTEVQTLAIAQGILFDCPTCRQDGHQHNICLPFRGRNVRPIVNGGHQWEVRGTGFENLTLAPSVNAAGGSCRWHGYITNGETTQI
jgi:hypothetical protein